jgi:hypothetical protein
MRYIRRIAIGAAVLVCAIPFAGIAIAQSPGDPPARIANEWDGRDHQPTRGGVRAAEQAQGTALSARQGQVEDQDLGAIQRQLLDEAYPAVPNPSP